MATLTVFSGLPATGKSSLARAVARHRRAAWLRVDTIEQALRDLLATNVEGEGYAILRLLAEENLRAGIDVIADSTNPEQRTRDWYHEAADRAGADCIDVEVICSDPAEHRERVASREVDIANIDLPTWEAIQQRTWHEWTSPRIVIDTAARPIEACVEELLAAIDRQQEE